jgi:hypothetical protein
MLCQREITEKYAIKIVIKHHRPEIKMERGVNFMQKT